MIALQAGRAVLLLWASLAGLRWATCLPSVGESAGSLMSEDGLTHRSGGQHTVSKSYEATRLHVSHHLTV